MYLYPPVTRGIVDDDRAGDMEPQVGLEVGHEVGPDLSVPVAHPLRPQRLAGLTVLPGFDFHHQTAVLAVPVAFVEDSVAGVVERESDVAVVVGLTDDVPNDATDRAVWMHQTEAFRPA